MIFELPKEAKEKVALAIYNSKPSMEEIRLGKKPSFLTSADVSEPFFVYVSGRLGPYYIDLRNVPSFPHHYRSILTNLIWYLDTLFGSENIDFVVSTESAGISWGQSVADRLGLPFCYARKEPKEYGTKKFIEGIIPRNNKGINIDDLVTTLKTVKNAVDGIRAEGSEVLACMPIFNRKQYSRKELNDLGAPVYHLIDIFDFVEAGTKTKNLSDENARLIRQYHEDEAAYALEIIKNNGDFIAKHPKRTDVLAGYKDISSKTDDNEQRMKWELVVKALKEILSK